MATIETKNSGMDLRVRRTYKLLMESLDELLKQKDFGPITVQEICQQAMVRRTTFYQHFQDKEDFLRWYLKEKFLEAFSGIDVPKNAQEMNNLMYRFMRDFNNYADREVSLMRILLDNNCPSKISSLGYALDHAFSALVGAETREKIEAEMGAPIKLWLYIFLGELMACVYWRVHQENCSTADMERYLRQINDMRAKMRSDSLQSIS